MLWAFSIILESVCVLPQLLLLRQTNVPTVIDSYYLVTLGSYRAFYILNWIWREEFEAAFRPPDTISVIFGVIQTALYIDFAWVYWTRQRVKLRSGGVVDGDDLRQSWFLGRIFGRFGGQVSPEDMENGDAGEGLNGNAATGPQRTSNWGSRGISVSADEGVLDSERERQRREDGGSKTNGQLPEYTATDAKMKDPDEMARILDGDEDSDEDIVGGAGTTVGNGTEWRNSA